MKYPIVGIQKYEREDGMHTIISYLKPLKPEHGQGQTAEKIFLNDDVDAKPGQKIEFNFEMGYNSKPYVTSYTVTD